MKWLQTAMLEAKFPRRVIIPFSRACRWGMQRLNGYIRQERGDLSGKDVIGLRCSTEADTRLSAETAKGVTSVDPVPEDICYVQKPAAEQNARNIHLLPRDIRRWRGLIPRHTIGCFLPEARWVAAGFGNLGANHVRTLAGGRISVGACFASVFLAFDESKPDRAGYKVKDPYFGKTPDEGESISGYACGTRHGVRPYFGCTRCRTSLAHGRTPVYTWSSFMDARKFPQNFDVSGNMQKFRQCGMDEYPCNPDTCPMSFSLKAPVYRR